MTSRLLLVEPSTTMRFVLDNYVQSLGHTVSSVGDYHEAVEALRDQFQSYDSDYDAVILGWPSIAVREADALTSLLEQDDFHSLPVIVMSTDQRAETRAWVADRPNSAMLAWKSYESIEDVLASLVTPSDNASSQSSTTESATSVKFDNSDIGILLIDDSPSIRESLTNVLTIHGYRIHAVASRDEAVEFIQDTPIDIAIVDFYLQDETGDEVCRAILREEPSLVCAILTSAYSDPIIKLSLRAGAVDCFFKNEAGELLLARIDALSRVVRQRKALTVEQQRLDRLVDTLAGATLLVSADNVITYVSQQAADKLGFDGRFELVGQPVSKILDPNKLKNSGDGRHQAQWVNAQQDTVDVTYRQTPIAETFETMLTFTFTERDAGSFESSSVTGSASAASTTAAGVSAITGPAATRGVSSSTSAAAATLSTPNIAATADPFLHQLIDYVDAPDKTADPVSLLIVGVQFRYNDGTVVPVTDHDSLSRVVTDSLLAIYRRENHVAQLAGHRYGFLLRHVDVPQSYLLTRKIMQLCNETTLPAEFSGRGELVVNGCLMGLVNHAGVGAHALLVRALSGLRAVDVRGVNQALLLDLKRMLPVYPEGS